MSTRKNTVKGARIYRWGDIVALSWKGVANSNNYLTPEMASALGNLLLDYAEDCRIHFFVQSSVGTQLVSQDGKVEKE